MTSTEKVELITEAADDMKAERIEVLDVRKKTSVADAFIVCSGNSDRHVDAIAERVAEKLSALKLKPFRTEGERSGWILQDYGDVILHVMKEEQRQFYDLESLWASIQANPDLD
ncbi:MAG TPA: ribosome silencing factor [Fimbriimonas sp.]|nr:ribosome silencing factor [Fimbriimonas sp.]